MIFQKMPRQSQGSDSMGFVDNFVSLASFLKDFGTTGDQLGFVGAPRAQSNCLDAYSSVSASFS